MGNSPSSIFIFGGLLGFFLPSELSGVLGCVVLFFVRIEKKMGSCVSSEKENTNNTPVVHEELDEARSYTFLELADITMKFDVSNLLGEGGFGRVYKGTFPAGKEVAVKKLNRDGVQGSSEFLTEVLMLRVLRHPNLVTLYGYCAEGDERLLVYEYLPQRSLEAHLFDLPPDKQPLEWNTRVKIAVGAAEGLAYLHDVANPPIIYRDMKAANILLDNNFNPKLSDFGLAKVGPVGDRTHVSTRVMGTHGYCAPDYFTSGRLTTKSDIYSFGVLLLELMTGRRALDFSKTGQEQNLLLWALPLLHERSLRSIERLADPLLQGRYPRKALMEMAAIAFTCIQGQPRARPVIADVVVALKYVATQPYTARLHARTAHPPSPSPSSYQGRARHGV